MFHAIHFVVWAILICGVCGYALLQGGATEQQGGVIAFVGWVATLVVEYEADPKTPVLSLFAIDFVFLLFIAGLAWRSRRSWPIWAAMFQALAILVHLAHELGVKINGFAYYAALEISSLGVYVSLGLGAFIAWRERAALRSFGIDDQLDTSFPARARSIRSSVRPTPKMATKDPKRGPWF